MKFSRSDFEMQSFESHRLSRRLRVNKRMSLKTARYRRNNDVLDNSSRSPQVINDWFINIALVGIRPLRRLNQSAPTTVSTLSRTFSPL